MNLVNTRVETLVRWQAHDRAEGPFQQGSYTIVTKDVGATIGVGVYDTCGTKLIHAFYAGTRHASYALEIARELIHDTVGEIRDDRGARFVREYFPKRFPAIVIERGYATLDPVFLADTCVCPTDSADRRTCPRQCGAETTYHPGGM